jgi:tricorn protease
MPAGYYWYPTIHNDTIIFVSEDDLWTVSACGGMARRLTANLGSVTAPALSPDGALLAFTGYEEGQPEVYTMPSMGGPATRLTYLGSRTHVIGWRPDGQAIIFASDSGQPFYGHHYL